MFNNVWFYILLYAAVGTVAVIINARNYKTMRKKLEEKSWGAVLEFDNRSLIHSSSRVITYILLIAACVLWPVFLLMAITKRTIAYKEIMKEELKREKWKKQFEEVKKNWLAQ